MCTNGSSDMTDLTKRALRRLDAALTSIFTSYSHRYLALRDDRRG